MSIQALALASCQAFRTSR